MLQKINWSAISPDESEKLKNELVEVWEASVRSTHRFLTEKDIRFFKPLIRNKYIPVVELYIIRNGQNRIAAFMGLSDELIEMLFVHPEEQGKGMWMLPETVTTKPIFPAGRAFSTIRIS